ncbi:MAG: hypothetical protein GTN70_07840 [Deltaproteobacteria bacterium]|nr:hypothetical protein [Deltaproteobacteria bacterium]NIS77609.1 hypothetical protein [Deltaproteobacteria bacterium]
MRAKASFTLAFIFLTATFCVGNSTASSNRFFDFSSGRNTAGFFTSFADDFSYYFGQVRTKPAGTFEVGLKGGAVEIKKGRNEGTGAYLGVDGNVRIFGFEGSFPFDLYLATGFSSILKSRRALNEFFIGPVGEKTLTSATALVIRGTLGMEVAARGGSLTDDDDLDLFITPGLVFNIGDSANIFLELKAGTDTAAGIGINFSF